MPNGPNRGVTGVENGLLEEHNPKDIPNRTRCFIKKIQANTLRGGCSLFIGQTPPQKDGGARGGGKKGGESLYFPLWVIFGVCSIEESQG